MSESLSEKEKSFIEEVGIVFEETGLPRMSGRILGWLLIADPPHQSSAQLAEVLNASKGSISTTTRLLVQVGMVERFIIPGVRHDYFRLKHNALKRTIEHGLINEIKMFHNLAGRGLDLMKDESSIRRRWLEEMRDRYDFLDRELPVLMERYEEKYGKKWLKPASEIL